MPDEFFEWLDKCPVQWFLNKEDDENPEYSFLAPEVEDEDECPNCGESGYDDSDDCTFCDDQEYVGVVTIAKTNLRHG